MPFPQYVAAAEGIQSSILFLASLRNDSLPFYFLANSHELAEIIAPAVILCYFLRHPFLQGRGTGVIKRPSENVDCDAWSSGNVSMRCVNWHTCDFHFPGKFVVCLY